MARLIALIRKEFLALLRDKASRMVLIGPPLIQLLYSAMRPRSISTIFRSW